MSIRETELRRRSKNFVDISLSFEPSPLNNDITVLKNERAINNALKNVITTVVWETPFNPDMGSQVTSYLFEDYGHATDGMLKLEIERAIQLNEPRVELQDVFVQSQLDDNQLVVRIEYLIIGYEEVYTVTHILEPTRS